jgi:hypothetical protein
VAWVAAGVLGLALPKPSSEGPTTVALAVLVLVFAVAKNIRDDDSAWGSYLGILLAVGVVVAAWLGRAGARRTSTLA